MLSATLLGLHPVQCVQGSGRELLKSPRRREQGSWAESTKAAVPILGYRMRTKQSTLDVSCSLTTKRLLFRRAETTTLLKRSISEEAAKYSRHLYNKHPVTDLEREASEKLFSLLGEGTGVDFSTSKEAGQPISMTRTEIDNIMSHLLPDSKSPGPDRIPNEFQYKTFATQLSPLVCDFLIPSNPKGFPRDFRMSSSANEDVSLRNPEAPISGVIQISDIGFVPNTLFIAEATRCYSIILQKIQPHLDNGMAVWYGNSSSCEAVSHNNDDERASRRSLPSMLLDVLKERAT
eukprot:1869619-Pleurochrysis_carterae.AAC.4